MRTVAIVLGLALLFGGLAMLFVHLLRPLVEAPSVASVVHTPSQNNAVATEAAISSQSEVAAAAPDVTGPRIAIMLSELGPDPKAAQMAIGELPAAIGLSFSPYPRESYKLAQAARAQGHEVWASVPMQPKSYPRIDPGPNTLLITNSVPENLRRLDWALARVGEPVGITVMTGSAFTENAAALRPVLTALSPQGMAILDTRSSPHSVVSTEARAIGVKAASNDRFLDEAGTIEANLEALEATARRNGSAIGFARALPASIVAIDAWAEGLEAKGIRLVPPGSLATAD